MSSTEEDVCPPVAVNLQSGKQAKLPTYNIYLELNGSWGFTSIIIIDKVGQLSGKSCQGLNIATPVNIMLMYNVGTIVTTI